MSNELREFLAAWLAWAENGAPDGPWFSRCRGLCICAARYGEVVNMAAGVAAELRDIFEAQGLDSSYPFGQWDYDTRFLDHTQHLDPNRLAWVREQLK